MNIIGLRSSDAVIGQLLKVNTRKSKFPAFETAEWKAFGKFLKLLMKKLISTTDSIVNMYSYEFRAELSCYQRLILIGIHKVPKDELEN